MTDLRDASILVTGGSGAFGRAFVRHALDAGARRVVVLSRGEAAQAAMRAEMRDGRLRFLLGDVRDADRVTDACRGVDTVIHAAAQKRVEVCEENPNEAVATNVLGTQYVARACIANGVRKAVFLSTDKAASPNTLYGATKFAAERMWIQSNVYSAGTPTRFSATRYGNVIGSTGSVVPLWRRQRETGSVTLTDPTMTRFLMRMDDAVQLVALALRHMRGGETFVPKIGSGTMGDLAHAVAPGCGWDITGVRPGEKHHELLISADEARYTYDAGDHYVIEPCLPLWESREPLTLPRVPERFEYASHTNPQSLTIDAMRALITS